MNHLCESEIEELIKLVAKHKGDESPLLLVLARMLVEKKEENKNYIDNFLTAADYCDDMYQEEIAFFVDRLVGVIKSENKSRYLKVVLVKNKLGKEDQVAQILNISPSKIIRIFMIIHMLARRLILFFPLL